MSENIQQHTALIETAFLDRNLSYNELNDFLEEFKDLSLIRWGKVTEHHDDFAGSSSLGRSTARSCSLKKDRTWSRAKACSMGS